MEEQATNYPIDVAVRLVEDLTNEDYYAAAVQNEQGQTNVEVWDYAGNFLGYL